MFKVLVALTLIAAAPVRAGTWGLHWTRGPGAEDCISGEALAVAVETRLGRSVFVNANIAQRTVEGRIEKAGNAWRTVLFVRAEQNGGTREHQSAAELCSDVDDAVIFIVTVLVDAPEELVRRPLRPSQVPSAIAAPRPSPRLEFDFWPVFGVGKIPESNAGLRIGAYGALEGGAGLEMALETWVPVKGVSSTAVELGICPAAFRPDRFLLTGCGSTAVGALFSHEAPASAFIDLNLRARAGWSLSQQVEITAGLAVGLRLPHRSATFEAGAGVSLRLW